MWKTFAAKVLLGSVGLFTTIAVIGAAGGTGNPSPSPSPSVIVSSPSARSTPESTSTPIPTATPSPSPIPAPTPSPQRALLLLTSVSSPVYPGEYATLTALTNPDAYCSIEVDYYSGPSVAAGLFSHTADGSGHISWTWKVGTRTYGGTWPIYVSCSSAAGSINRNTTFVVE